MTTVLDHGYVEHVQTWGSDEDVIRAARMSTRKGFQGWPQDEKLLRYLWKNNHATPFEFGGMIVEVRAPIFVVREWHRHRTFAFNEASARYSPLPALDYIPSLERLTVPSAVANKQAAASKQLTREDAESFREVLGNHYADLEHSYQLALGAGVPRELARVLLPVGRYTTMRAQANLRNWLAFVKLRDAANAQWEIQEYARACRSILREHFPRTLALFDEGA